MIRSDRASGSSWATSWKLWIALLLLGLLLIAVSISLPAIRRYKAFQFLHRHRIQYELTDKNEWVTETFGNRALGFREVRAISMEGAVSDEVSMRVAEFDETKVLVCRESDRSVSLSRRGAEALQELNQLEQVILYGPGFSDANLALWFSSTPHLSEVRLHRIDVSRGTFEALCRIQSIARLYIEECPLDDDVFVNLQPLENVLGLALHDTGVGDNACAWIAQSSRLKILNLSRNAMSNGGLKDIARITGLERLVLLHCPNISDAGILHLANLIHLQSLELPANAISQRSIDALRGIPTLKMLEVSGSISDSDLRRQMIDYWDYSDHLTRPYLR